jgi:addiction module HigA family antidote
MENPMSIRIEDLHNTNFSDVAEEGNLPPLLPGEILLEEFMKPMGISQNQLAMAICVSPRRIGEIIAGKRAINVDTGLRLSRYFGMNDGFWVGLQIDYETALARTCMSGVLDNIKPFQKQSAVARS